MRIHLKKFIYKIYVSKFNQQITNDKTIILNICYTIERILNFFISKIMITNNEKIKNIIKIDDEITNKNQKMYNHFNEIESKIIYTKCDRYHIKLKNQFKFSKKNIIQFFDIDKRLFMLMFKLQFRIRK